MTVPPVRASSLLNLLSLGNFVVGMGAFVVIGIISPIADGLGVAKSEAAVILTAYALGYALLSPVGAALTGRFSRRSVLAAALGLFCIGSVISAIATSLSVLAASRLVVALGAALYTPLSAGVAVAISAPEQRGRALARVFGGMTLAQVAGVPLGAWLSYQFGWHSAFWASAGLAALVAAILVAAVPRDVTVQATTLRTILSALGDFRLMFAVAFTGTIMTAFYILFTYFGPLIEANVGGDPETRTFYLVLYGLGAVAGNVMGGQMTDRLGPRRTLIVICVTQILLMPLLSITWSPALFAMIVALWSAFGWSFMAPQQLRLVAIAPRAQALALALNAAMIYVGIAIGSGIAGRLLAWQGLGALGIGGGIAAGIALLHLLASGRKAAPGATLK